MQLLFRDGKAAHITEAGAVFLEQCDSLLRHVDSVEKLIKSAKALFSENEKK